MSTGWLENSILVTVGSFPSDGSSPLVLSTASFNRVTRSSISTFCSNSTTIDENPVRDVDVYCLMSEIVATRASILSVTRDSTSCAEAPKMAC